LFRETERLPPEKIDFHPHDQNEDENSRHSECRPIGNRSFPLGQDSTILVANRLKCLGQSSPTGKGVFEYIGMRAGIEKHISVRML
jgi:hypothetical protein